MASTQLFEDIFEVLARDPDGKKFDTGGAASRRGAATLAVPPGSRVCRQAAAGRLSTMRVVAHMLLCCAVSRYQCRSELYECDLTLDVNVEVYPLEVRSEWISTCLWVLSSCRQGCGHTDEKQHIRSCHWCTVQVGHKYLVALASTLNADGSASSTKYDAVSRGCVPQQWDPGQDLAPHCVGRCTHSVPTQCGVCARACARLLHLSTAPWRPCIMSLPSLQLSRRAHEKHLLLSGTHPCGLCYHVPRPQTFPGFSNKPSLMDRYEYVMYGKVRRGTTA